MLNPSILPERLRASQPHTPHPKMTICCMHARLCPTCVGGSAAVVQACQVNPRKADEEVEQGEADKEGKQQGAVRQGHLDKLLNPYAYLSASGIAYLQKRNLDGNHGCYRPRELDTLKGHLMFGVKLVCCDHQPMYRLACILHQCTAMAMKCSVDGSSSELSYVVWLCHVAMSVKEGHEVLVLPGIREVVDDIINLVLGQNILHCVHAFYLSKSGGSNICESCDVKCCALREFSFLVNCTKSYVDILNLIASRSLKSVSRV